MPEKNRKIGLGTLSVEMSGKENVCVKMASNKKCVICQLSDESDSIPLLNSNKLQKCLEVRQVREKLKLKYSEVFLPAEINETHGCHFQCYKNFTAVPKKYITKYMELMGSRTLTDIPSTSSTSTSTDSVAVETSGGEEQANASTSTQQEVTNDNIENTDNVEKQPVEESNNESVEKIHSGCIYCEKIRKTVKGRCVTLRTYGRETIENVIIPRAHTLNDVRLLQILNDKSNNSNQFQYHRDCHRDYDLQVQSILNPRPPSAWQDIRDSHREAFQEVCYFIEDHVIKNKQCVFFSFVIRLYNETLGRLCKEKRKEFWNPATVYTVEKKKIEKYNEEIQITTAFKKKMITPVRDFVLTEEDIEFLREEDILQKAAVILRSKVLNIEKRTLPTELNVKHIISGECSIPPDLNNFFLTMIGGTRSRRRQNEDCQRKIQSISYDVINAITKGRIKTSKHLALGMAMKSLTSCRKVVDILNKYGHCCSYNVIEEMETELTYSSTNRDSLCSVDVVKSGNLSTGIAFDNYDRFVDTHTGKDTLHDTVGIIYQSIPSPTTDQQMPDIEPSPSTSTASETVTALQSAVISMESARKRRRTFDNVTHDLEPYYKKPRVVETLLTLEDERRDSIPKNLNIIRSLDKIWMLSHCVEIPKTPMWVGYNSKLFNDNSSTQKISYLTPINLSPTKWEVVHETLVQCQKIAEELEQPYMEVTYDLAIAKMAMQIQATEGNKFNNYPNMSLYSDHRFVNCFSNVLGKFFLNLLRISVFLCAFPVSLFIMS